jgi:hypothetical protein
MGPYDPNSFQDFQVNVPQGTSGDVIQQILGNLPNIAGALGGIFGSLFGGQQQQPPPEPKQDLTPLYLIAGLALVLTLTKK